MSHGTPGPGPAGEEPEPTVRLPTAVDPGPGPGGPEHGAVRHVPGPGEPGGGRARRFWSSRRIPAAVTAAVIFGLSGLFLYDLSSVRAGRKGMYWRTKLADELATRHLDDVWIILGASVCAAVGLWLIVLAVTPGERSVLPMARRGPDGVRGGLDRHAAELVLRDRAMEVSGIRSARAVVKRRRVKIRAGAHFRDLDDVRRDLTEAMEDAVRQLGLARAPRLRVHLQRVEKGA
ncbi:DUF6286 domain-containing protein [Actinacidiphila acidipaludis]|uniref:DUF6286 domain-containing protein n=1 Tax=Actinacidiphila acidipaludis TaxID=2873382 RepID=A0ABS7QB50_9ACTN|nr:DUF6286 domain-containing protein [Streptomyces acidipaludis]MBY8880356.1 DUF6286 domain-containing protein [Streptomyces acidipaludis]